ncbi:MAG: AbrB/MazE/SpoVT family DNA-binding domain-containing protein [Firmicutes bacterium]|nr:AbrB/MazE/SpoVT family DNA-binding domain-containing protein [Bacillota bacterium]
MRKKEKRAAEETDQGRYMGSVKVGGKGQIVIPKEARALLGIKPGDTLLLLADVERGIAIHRMDFFNRMADAIFSGKHKPDEWESDRDLSRFAGELKRILGEEEH